MNRSQRADVQIHKLLLYKINTSPKGKIKFFTQKKEFFITSHSLYGKSKVEKIFRLNAPGVVLIRHNYTKSLLSQNKINLYGVKKEEIIISLQLNMEVYNKP